MSFRKCVSVSECYVRDVGICLSVDWRNYTCIPLLTGSEYESISTHIYYGRHSEKIAIERAIFSRGWRPVIM